MKTVTIRLLLAATTCPGCGVPECRRERLGSSKVANARRDVGDSHRQRSAKLTNENENFWWKSVVIACGPLKRIPAVQRSRGFRLESLHTLRTPDQD